MLYEPLDSTFNRRGAEAREPSRHAHWSLRNALIETQIDVLLVQESALPDSLSLFIRCRNLSAELNGDPDCGSDEKSSAAN